MRQRIGFRPLLIRQIETIREGHQIIETQRSSHGGESRPPGLQTLQKRRPGIPYTVGREVGPERMDRHEVQRKFRIGIEQDSPHRLLQLQGSSGVRTTEKAATIVIVGEEIVPNQRRTTQNLSQPSDRFHIQRLGDDLRTRPKDVDVGVKTQSKDFQIPLASMTCCNHPCAVGRWAHQKTPLSSRSTPCINLINPGSLSRRQRSPASQIFRAHRVWDVIEQDAKVVDAVVQQLSQATLNGCHVGGIRIRHIQSRTAGVNKTQTALPASGHRLPNLHQTGFIVRLPPDGSLMQIILGTIEIGVQAAANHPIPKLVSLGRGPRRAVETLDHAG